MTSLFEKLKSIQSDVQVATPQEEVTPKTQAQEPPSQCDCGSSISGECDGCDGKDESSGLPIIETLRKIGDEHQINPPEVDDCITNEKALPVESPEEIEEIYKSNNEALGITDPLLNDDDGRKVADTTPKKKTPCPTCGKEFQQLGKHKCKMPTIDTEAPEYTVPADEPVHDSTETPSELATRRKAVKAEKKSVCIGDIVSRVGKRLIEGTVSEPPAPPEQTEGNLPTESDQGPRGGYTLLLNASVYLMDQKHLAIHFSDILPPLCEKVAKGFSVPNWGMSPYGQGPGCLAQLLEKWLVENNPQGFLMVISGSKEYMACQEVLLRRASMVIMGVR